LKHIFNMNNYGFACLNTLGNRSVGTKVKTRKLSVLLSPWSSQTDFGVSSSNLCYSIETTIVHFSLLCFYCDYVNFAVLMYSIYILC